MSQVALEQFNKGFFTMSGAVAALAIVYPMYHSCQVLCNRFFRKTKYNDKCDC
jgi:hypothetical protein